jgi:hypothetical protein
MMTALFTEISFRKNVEQRTSRVWCWYRPDRYFWPVESGEEIQLNALQASAAFLVAIGHNYGLNPAFGTVKRL